MSELDEYDLSTQFYPSLSRRVGGKNEMHANEARTNDAPRMKKGKRKLCTTKTSVCPIGNEKLTENVNIAKSKQQNRI